MNKKTLLLVFLITLIVFTKVNAQEELVPPPPPPSITFDEQEEQKYLAKFNAETRSNLEKIKTFNKDKYRYLLRDGYFRRMEPGSYFWKKADKQYFERQNKISELNIATEALAAEYHRANESKKTELRKKLKIELSKLFDLREAERKEELARLEQEMLELKTSLKVRTEKKDMILDRRIQSLLGEEDYLDWD
ncbi:MAG: hypothetical protein JEY94_04535 [Melioribacteraceae bacterium]|nr:hypothetical protein [Melioribacteraceae bacterium]